jgi:hypothetical protein
VINCHNRLVIISSESSRRMTELQRDSPLFDKMLVIRLQSGIQEARQIPLTVRIIPGIRPTSIHGQNEKLFHFEVSCLDNPA